MLITVNDQWLFETSEFKNATKHIMNTSEPNANIIVIIIPFDIYNYTSSAFHRPLPDFLFSGMHCTSRLNVWTASIDDDCKWSTKTSSRSTQWTVKCVENLAMMCIEKWGIVSELFYPDKAIRYFFASYKIVKKMFEITVYSTFIDSFVYSNGKL